MEESQFPIPSFYAFRYANKAAAGYQHCSYVVANFITPFLFLHIIISIMFMADLDKYISFEPLLWVLFVCGIIGLVLSIKYATGFKGVTLYKDHLEITMHSLFTKRFRPTVSIMYKDIASVYNSRLNLRSQGMRQKWSMLVDFGDYQYYTEIRLLNGKQICVSVENQEAFAHELSPALRITPTAMARPNNTSKTALAFVTNAGACLFYENAIEPVGADRICPLLSPQSHCV